MIIISAGKLHDIEDIMKKLFPLFFITCLFLAGCSSNTSEAEKVAREWFLAVNKMDSLKADSLVCSEVKSEFRQNLAINSAIYLFAGQLNKDIKIDIDDSEMKYQATSISNNEVNISVSGEIRGSISGMVSSDILEEEWKIIKEDGKWKWCGWIRGHTNLAKISSNEQQSEEPVNSEKNKEPDKPAYKIIGYSISSKDADKKPGWTNYNIKIGISSSSDKPVIVKFPDKNQISVITEDDNTYDNGKFVEHVKTGIVDQYNNLSLSTDYFYLLPPKAIISARGVGTGDWIYKIPKTFHIDFLVPSTLKPKELTANNINPISWDEIASNFIEFGDAIKNVPENYEFPYSSKNESPVKFEISNPRATNEINQFSTKNEPVITMDIDVTNTDKTGDNKFVFRTSVIDGWGTIYADYSTGCQGNDRDYKLESSNPTVIGPGQTVKGSICIGLGLITEEALSKGDYIINFSTSDGVGWFKVNLPFSERGSNNENINEDSGSKNTTQVEGNTVESGVQTDNTESEDIGASSSQKRAIITGNVYFVNLRKTPGFSNKNDKKDVVIVIPSGEEVRIISGPKVADGINWWYADWSGYRGWIAERRSSGGQILDFQ